MQKNDQEKYIIDNLLCSNEDLLAPYHDVIFPRTEEQKKENLEYNKKMIEEYKAIYDKDTTILREKITNVISSIKLYQDYINLRSKLFNE